MTIFIQHNDKCVLLEYKELKVFEDELTKEIKNSAEQKKLNNLILEEFIAAFPETYIKKFDEAFYASFFVKLNSLLRFRFQQIDFHSKDVKNELIQEIKDSLYQEENRFYLIIEQVISRLYKLILSSSADFSYFNLEQNKLEKFIKTIINSDEALVFKNKFKNYFVIKNESNIINLENSDYNFSIKIDHMKNIKKFFPKKGILLFLHIFKNRVLFEQLYKNEVIFNDPVSVVQHFLECATKNKRFFLNTLYFSAFHPEKHFQHAKKIIKQNFGLNNNGYSVFSKSNFDVKHFIKSPFVFSIIDFNNFQIDGKIKKERCKPYNPNFSQYKIEQQKFSPKNLPFLNSFKERLRLNEKLNDDLFDSDNYYEEFDHIEKPYFYEFIEGKKQKTIFLKNVNNEIFNNNYICSYYYKIHNNYILNSQMSLFKLVPNLFLNTKRQHSLFFDNIFFYFDQFYLSDSNVNYNLFYYLYSEYLKQNPSCDNLFFILNELLKEFKVYCSDNNVLIQFYDNLLTELNLLEIINEEQYKRSLIQLGQKIINKIGGFFSYYNIYSTFMFRKMIYILTKISISDYYPGLIFRSFCIEYYLVHLFEKHYQRNFNDNNEKDLKYISKLAEKYHKNFNTLLEKSFEYTKEKYDIFILNRHEKKVSASDNFYELTNFQKLKNYHNKNNALLIDDFFFKPLTKVADLFKEGKKMGNCLYKTEDYQNDLNNIVFSVSCLNNNKFKINLKININDKENIYISEGPYSKYNKKNELLVNEFSKALTKFLKILNDEVQKKKNVSEYNIDKKTYNDKNISKQMKEIFKEALVEE